MAVTAYQNQLVGHPSPPPPSLSLPPSPSPLPLPPTPPPFPFWSWSIPFQITKLKIEKNPFAKGFRDPGGRDSDYERLVKEIGQVWSNHLPYLPPSSLSFHFSQEERVISHTSLSPHSLSLPVLSLSHPTVFLSLLSIRFNSFSDLRLESRPLVPPSLYNPALLQQALLTQCMWFNYS